MADGLDRNSNSLLLGVLLGVAVAALGVLGYLYYDHVTHRSVVKIDVPGFSGEITKDKGVNIDVGKP